MEKFDDQLYGDRQFKFRSKTIYQTYAQAIKDLFQPESITDLGCANGYSLEWWQAQGIKIYGLEPAQAALKYIPKKVRPFVKQLDLRHPLNLDPADVVNFTEVAEHIDKKYEFVMLNNVIRCVRNFLIISWSSDLYVDQPKDHINPQSLHYVKARLKQQGLFFEAELTRELKLKLQQPIFTHWRHWEKNILVFSRTPPAKRILILHNEYQESYKNKNIGYFMAQAKHQGYGVRFITRGNNWINLFRHWHRVWLYPFEKHLLIKLLILKLFGNKIILKMDSVIFPRWRARLIEQLADYILVESTAVARPFTKKLIYFSGGLPQINIDLIKTLKIKREKIILYCGRQTYQKGFDRLKKIIPPGWQLKIAADLKPKAYYQAILTSSLVVLPTRGEGWPNVFQDAFFCRRLFLTTRGAQCREAILDPVFYCDNSVGGLKKSIKQITTNLDTYYRNYSRLYDSVKFVQADKVFLSLITNEG